MSRSPAVISMSDSGGPIGPEDIAPTVLPDAFLTSDIAQAARTFRLPRYAELPAMPLYRDQVATYVEQLFAPLATCSDGPWITASMVNNYVKHGLIPAPVKKQYGRPQLARLIVICIFKQFLPMAAIERLFSIQRMTYPEATAFDYVAVELEGALRAAFSQGRQLDDTAHRVTRESLLVRSAVGAFAAKAYLMSYLRFSGLED